MQAVLLVMIIAAIGGLAAGFQAPLVGMIEQRIGTWESVFITYGGGGLLAIILFGLIRGAGNLGDWRSLPWYAVAGGPLGLIIIGTLSYTVPRLGVATTITIFIAVQLILSALFDHFGLLGTALRPVDSMRLLGLSLLLLGTWLVVR